MSWTTIRLELGPTANFPNGSASRAFLLRAPLDDDGQLNMQEIASDPTLATVRRYWASERDEFGQLEHTKGSWVFRPSGKGNDGKSYSFPNGPFQANAQIYIRQADGTELPFRVVSMTSSGKKPTRKDSQPPSR